MKKIQYFFALLLLLSVILSPTLGDSEDGSENSESQDSDEGEEEVGDGYGNGADDDAFGLFNFYDDMDWTEYAIEPLACFSE